VSQQEKYETIDFFTDPSLVEDPYPYFDYLRSQAPVVRLPHHGVVAVTGYDEAVAVYKDTDTFSSCNSVVGPFAPFPVRLEGDDISETIARYRDQLPMHEHMVTMDPPDHSRERAVLMRLITPRRLKENEEFMWRLADRQIDEFVDRGECEFVHGYASPFTLLVIADLLGVPEEDHETFREELQGGRRRRQFGSADGGMVAHKPLEFLYDRFTRFIEDRRREPRADVMTELAHATFPDGSLPPVDDVMRISANLFAAGQETTARMLGTALRLIGERPELQQQLRDRRDVIPRFIEECVRIESPLQGQFRMARVPATVGGVDVPAGGSVFVMPGAANRDPRQFPDPAEFKLDRANGRQHVGFGFGIHTCAGAPLARAEGDVSINRLLDRMADIRVSEAEHGPPGERRYAYTPIYLMRGLEQLYLEFTPVA
jgi:cytochrome P450